MSGDDLEQVQQSDGVGSGFSRREALKRGAIIGGAVVWATPIVQGVGLTKMSAAVASHGGTHPCCLGASGYDVLATFTGPVSGTVGPVRGGAAPYSDCFANLSLTAPGQADPFVTAAQSCVTASSDPCRAEVDLTDVAVDLTKVHSVLNVQLSLSVIDAHAECACGGGCNRDSCIGTATLTVAGTPTTLAVCPDDNQSITIHIPDVLTGTLTLNEKPDGSCEVNAIHLVVQTIDTQIVPSQTVDLVIGHAEADCA